jgi:uncharacterized membrane protein YphA (DoxX/SURF4 family)
MNLRQSIGILTRIIVGGVLIYSGASKALAPSAEFAAALAEYHILPAALLTSMAVIWPWVEIFVGTYILFGYFTRLFAGVASGMFLIFLTVLASALVRGINPGSCGCFGAGLSLSLHKGIALDTILLVFSLLLARIANSPLRWSADAWINNNHV